MIRVTRQDNGTDSATLVVEGRVDARSAVVLVEACEDLLAEDRRVVLECSDIVFVDPRGIETLRALREQGVELAGCRDFVEGLLSEA